MLRGGPTDQAGIEPGAQIAPGSPGVEEIVVTGREFLEVDSAGDPALKSGVWRLRLNGLGLFWVNIKVTSGLHLACLGPSWSHTAGQVTRLRVGLVADDPGWQPVSANFRLTSLTGNTAIPLTM